MAMGWLSYVAFALLSLLPAAAAVKLSVATKQTPLYSVARDSVLPSGFSPHNIPWHKVQQGEEEPASFANPEERSRLSLLSYQQKIYANLIRHRAELAHGSQSKIDVDKTESKKPLISLSGATVLVIGICANLTLVACMMGLGIFM
eukprot:TRINITY_DN19564_c2_g1_i1.p1 TRINITY_DN19564_c2_g1~~TRINITY_DN19564_c2_g1_i1.p1  ORF type:complete len:164 (+),score=20.94 TRINITY_DN19564_c2_g1_i1:56-493(+)